MFKKCGCWYYILNVALNKSLSQNNPPLMKSHILLLLAGLTIGCTQTKSDSQTSMVDSVSVSVSVDSTTAESTIITPAEPPIKPELMAAPELPAFSEETFTDDSLESVFINALISQLKEFEKGRYVTATSTYAFTYQVGNDYDESTSDASMREKKTWYFDANRNLRAVTSEHQSDTDSTTIIYLVDGDKLTACYHDNFYSGQDSGIHRKRIVVSNCPTCGVFIDLSSYKPSTKLDKSEVAYAESLMIKDYEQLQDICNRSVNMQKTKTGFRLSEKLKFGETPYTALFEFHESLYNKLIKTN